jgi:hypothetical protein
VEQAETLLDRQVDRGPHAARQHERWPMCRAADGADAAPGQPRIDTEDDDSALRRVPDLRSLRHPARQARSGRLLGPCTDRRIPIEQVFVMLAVRAGAARTGRLPRAAPPADLHDRLSAPDEGRVRSSDLDGSQYLIADVQVRVDTSCTSSLSSSASSSRSTRPASPGPRCGPAVIGCHRRPRADDSQPGRLQGACAVRDLEEPRTKRSPRPPEFEVLQARLDTRQ